jgi:drug/metabolite transporter (DMT)-like permease
MVATRGGVWLVCLSYFLCYIPFISFTRWLSTAEPVLGDTMVGAEVLPIATMASAVVMVLFIVASGWWKLAGRRRVARWQVPWPGHWMALSGLCTAVILTTSTMIFSLGVPIVLAMLITRCGTLIIAPIVDVLTGRRVHPSSWVALGLSAAALFVAVHGRVAGDWNVPATICVSSYLLAYFVRLQFMSRLAKSDDTKHTKRYFVEEQFVTAPLTLLLLGAAALLGGTHGLGGFFAEARRGFTDYWTPGFAFGALAVGVFSQLVGIFGTLIFLNPRENSFSTS